MTCNDANDCPSVRKHLLIDKHCKNYEKENIILRLPWLAKVNSTVDWKEWTLSIDISIDQAKGLYQTHTSDYTQHAKHSKTTPAPPCLLVTSMWTPSMMLTSTSTLTTPNPTISHNGKVPLTIKSCTEPVTLGPGRYKHRLKLALG